MNQIKRLIKCANSIKNDSSTPELINNIEIASFKFRKNFKIGEFC